MLGRISRRALNALTWAPWSVPYRKFWIGVVVGYLVAMTALIALLTVIKLPDWYEVSWLKEFLLSRVPPGPAPHP